MQQYLYQATKEQSTTTIPSLWIRLKGHLERAKLVGIVDNDEFINSNKTLPKGFDFAIWNAAQPDQQTDFLQGTRLSN